MSLTVNGELLSLDIDERRGAVRITPVACDGVVDHELWLEDAEGATVVHFRNQVQAPAFLSDNVDAGVVQSYVEQTAAFALANIKTILEAHQEDNVAAAIQQAADLLPPAPPLGEVGG